MELTEKDIYATISGGLPKFERVGSLESIQGGNLNHVWRLHGKNRNLIIKHAPPYIASNPEVPLDSNRINFEAKALKLFEPEEKLHLLASDQIRPPECLLYKADQSLLIMEDIGPVPTIDSWINEAGDLVALGELLGRFIGLLHKTTFNDPNLGNKFNNKSIQQTRNQIQYQPAADYAGKIISIRNTNLKTRTRALGETLLKPGKCLVMGDLWPASILIENNNLRLIDWEFVHFGRPLQDVGHFAAHCWMQAHTSSSHKAHLWKKLWLSYWQKYQKTTGDLFKKLFNKEEHTFMTTHIGAEILIRATGPFKSGYVYEHFSPSHPKIKEAASEAIQISGSDINSIWDFLPSKE
jgi:5-methylthioribose kinase